MHAWIVAFRPRRLRIVSRPVVHTFDERRFIFRPHGTSFGEALPFEWEALDSLLPSLRGTVTLHRFGPIVVVMIEATFSVTTDVAGKLIRESVGSREAAQSLRYLCRSLHRLIAKPPERVKSALGSR